MLGYGGLGYLGLSYHPFHVSRGGQPEQGKALHQDSISTATCNLIHKSSPPDAPGRNKQGRDNIFDPG